ncbi:MFS transporter [Nocardia terpenica]|uniref:DHA2 family efflux MFS transporter permease subunit n=1 Tax=Nocardia terpenica TaxID=455432 RepID=A0A6G9YZ05_9NOCA|nr:MFS transporter [Nocardia terpenica]QIS18478.1 DHA2 family efflux MFS transporter permease subunit [Nocardia terpenica]
MTHQPVPTQVPTRSPWIVLMALCVGFFMILLDMTIVAVANPAIAQGLHTDIPKVIWVTSAYLLTYSVPLLVTGRLGDRFGPKNLYLIGLTIFTIASLGCALAGSIGVLIATRAVQGLGAALVAPQTMSVITRIFPAERRGAAMGAWSAVAGVATLTGPIVGGVLVDNAGWQWIFYVNLPIGMIGFVLAWMLVPALPTNSTAFDIPGVVLSAAGMTMLVFGIQEGNSYHWAVWVWTLITAGLMVLAGFLVYQARNAHREVLVPMGLFKNRNFALGSIAWTGINSTITALVLPIYFYLQVVRGFSPTKSALIFAPMAIGTGLLAPVMGKIADRLHPRYIPTLGFAIMVAFIAVLAQLMMPHSYIGWFLVAAAVMGLAGSCIWPPVSATATRNLPLNQAGAGAGIFNTTRQVGAVLASAGMSALITSRMSAHGLPSNGTMSEGGRARISPAQSAMGEWFRHAFSNALSDSMYLPVGILVISMLATACFARPKQNSRSPQSSASDDLGAIAV